VDLFYAPMRLLLERPYLALVPALLFWLGYRAVRPRAPRLLVGVAVLWALYAAYETYMYFWSKTVTAPIRVDLLLLGPVLYIATGVGLVAWWRARGRRARGGDAR
jgi:hypothetical protein